MATALQGLVALCARLMLAAIFLASAIGNKIPQFQATSEYMLQQGVPQPKLALVGAHRLAAAWRIGGFIAGAWTRIGAIFLLIF